MSLHPVEVAWRQFRRSPGGRLLAQSLALRGSYMDSIGLSRLPAEIVLPGAVPWNILALEEARARGERTGDRLSTEGTRLANTVAVWAAYRDAKTIYTVDALLVEGLARTPWPDQVPTAALRLPSRCAVLSIPWGLGNAHVAAHYDLLTRHEASGRLELRLSLLIGQLWQTISILHLVGEDLGACVRDAAHVTAELAEEQAARSARNVERSRMGLVDGNLGIQADAFHWDLPGLALTVLLYLGGEPDIVRQIHPGARPEREARMRRRDPDRWQDLREPEVSVLGTAYRAAIERWEMEQRAPSAERREEARTVRPHVRRAHAHLYWTGRGREIPRVRFLLPIPVHGAALPDERPGTSQTPVR
jgi:hypothetical protein